MKKYAETYRWMRLRATDGKLLKDDDYLACADGGMIYRRSSTVLVFYKEGAPDSFVKALKRKKVWFDSWLDDETEIRFLETDLTKLARTFKLLKVGARISKVKK